MKTKLLIAAAVAALSIGATGAQAAPAISATDVVTQSTDSAVAPTHHHFRFGFYYNYYPYYYYNYYSYCYWSPYYGKVCY